MIERGKKLIPNGRVSESRREIESMSIKVSEPKPNVRPRRLVGRLVLLAIALSAVAVLIFHGIGPGESELLNRAEIALQNGRYSDAKQLAERVLERSPESTRALLIAGDADHARTNLDSALKYYERIPRDTSAESVKARTQSGVISLKLGRADSAEQFFRGVVKDAPAHLQANLLLAKLLGAECRRREAVPFVIALFRQNHVDLKLLTMLGIEDGRLVDLELLKRCLKREPDNAIVLTGLACHAHSGGDPERAVRLLQRATRANAPGNGLLR